MTAVPHVAVASADATALQTWRLVREKMAHHEHLHDRQLQLGVFVPRGGVGDAAMHALTEATAAVQAMSGGRITFRLYPRLFGYTKRTDAYMACEDRLMAAGADACLWLNPIVASDDDYQAWCELTKDDYVQRVGCENQDQMLGAAGSIRLAHLRGRKMFWLEATSTSALVHELGHLIGMHDLYDVRGRQQGIAQSSMGLVRTNQSEGFDIFFSGAAVDGASEGSWPSRGAQGLFAQRRCSDLARRRRPFAAWYTSGLCRKHRGIAADARRRNQATGGGRGLQLPCLRGTDSGTRATRPLCSAGGQTSASSLGCAG